MCMTCKSIIFRKKKKNNTEKSFHVDEKDKTGVSSNQ